MTSRSPFTDVRFACPFDENSTWLLSQIAAAMNTRRPLRAAVQIYNRFKLVRLRNCGGLVIAIRLRPQQAGLRHSPACFVHSGRGNFASSCCVVVEGGRRMWRGRASIPHQLAKSQRNEPNCGSALLPALSPCLPSSSPRSTLLTSTARRHLLDLLRCSLR